MDNRWKGVRFRTSADLAVPADDATHVMGTGYDHLPGTTLAAST